MKYKISVFILFFSLCFNNIFAQNNSENNLEESSNNSIVYSKSDGSHWTTSLLYVTTMEITLSFYNMVFKQEDYSFINLDTMYNNLVNPWFWDSDEFYINQLYHPYQGSMYFIAGRSNGLSFYESLFTNLYGTLLWEYFMEIDTPAVNDLIITEITGSYVGEIFHRSYQLLEDVCLPVAVIISPFDALTKMITGQKTPRCEGSLDYLSFSGGYSYLFAKQFKSSFPDYNICDYPNLTYENVKAYNQTSNLFFKLDYGYGKRFGHNTKSPLDTFNLQFTTINRDGHFYYSIITDGLLYSKALNTSFDSTFGIVYNFDYLMGSDLNYNNNSVGVSFDLKNHFYNLDDNYLTFGISANFCIDGASEYYYLHSDFIRADQFGQKQRLYDIGFGPNFKLYSSYQNPKFGKVFLNSFLSIYFTPEFTKPTQGSLGNNLIAYLEAGYEHQVYNNFSLGLSEILYYKKGNYKTADDITHKMSFTNFYVKYAFK